jgi:glucokinase
MATVIGMFDIGGSRSRVAISLDGEHIERMKTFTTGSTLSGLKGVTDALLELADGRKFRAVAGGIAGQVDSKSGILRLARNLPDWNGVVIAHELEQRLGVHVLIDNDVAVVGLGEAHFGAGRGYALVMYETVSTGVNAARIVDGRIDCSARGFEIGRQLIVGTNGRLTNLEAATGGAALERKYGRPPAQLGAHGLWRSEARLLALGLYNSILHWSPEVVIMGGAMMRDISLDSLQEALANLPEVWADYPPIVHATLGDNGGLYGGMVLAREYLRASSTP